MDKENESNYYCSTGFDLKFGSSCNYAICNYAISEASHRCNTSCRCCHRKWPTPEQFEQEYGREFPDGGAIYVFDNNKWKPARFGYWKDWHDTPGSIIDCTIAVIACSPFGPPPDTWRPE